jgi:flagellar hook-basal body complex protein FliE
MYNSYVPKLSMENPFRQFSDDINLTGHVIKTGQAAGPSFQSVMSETLGQVNEVVSKPDAMLQDAMTTGNVDIHEVMIANAKAEMTVNLTAQFTTKIIQAYDRILQIQI